MSQQKLLSPVPEIFWRVDRNLQEYRERSGIDLLKLIDSMQEICNSGDVILELGSGCGYAASEMKSNDAIKSFFSLFSINDMIHFPVRSLIGEILELDLEYKSLSEKAKSEVVDYVYKILSLEKGTTTSKQLNYDQKFLSLIQSDVNNLIPALSEINIKLSDAVGVPSEFGVIPLTSEQREYPNKIFLDDLRPSASEYIKSLSNNPYNHINPDVINSDIYEYLSINPIGMLVGDFLEISKLSDHSLAFVFSIRGTTYLVDDKNTGNFAYSDLLIQILKKLQQRGIYLDDGVRENFGKRYRLPELLRVQKVIDQSHNSDTLWLIIGPGVPGDDFNQEAAIRSVAITKGSSDPRILSKNLGDEKYSVRSFLDVINDKEYLCTLDPQKSNYREVQSATS